MVKIWSFLAVARNSASDTPRFERITDIVITCLHHYIKGEQVITVPKTERSVRTIDIPQTLADMVKEYIGSLYDYDPDQRLFMFTKSSLRKQVTQACNATGVKQIRLHDLRHSHAALLISLGTEILLVSERLGHENVETTLNVYGHLYPSRREKTVQKLDELAKVVPK